MNKETTTGITVEEREGRKRKREWIKKQDKGKRREHIKKIERRGKTKRNINKLRYDEVFGIRKKTQRSRKTKEGTRKSNTLLKQVK